MERKTVTEFQELIEKDNSEILTILCDLENEFLYFLQENEVNRDILAYALIAIGKVCQLLHEDRLPFFLISIFQSKNFSHILLPRYLAGFLLSDHSRHHVQSLESVVKMFSSLNCLFPALAVDIIKIIFPLLRIVCMKILVKDESCLKLLMKDIDEIDEASNDFASSFSRPDIEKAAEAIHLEMKQPPNNIRDVPIFPTMTDIKDHVPFLRPVLCNGSYANVNHYLDVYFRLLREDFVGSLRKGVVLYSSLKEKHRHLLNMKEIKIYPNVKIVAQRLTEDEVLYDMQFDIKHFKHVNWEYTNRLRKGSLTCLSNDDFQTMHFAIVENPDRKDLSKGKLLLNFMEDFPFSASDQHVCFVMLESDAYFEAYQYNLAALQRMADSVPLQKYIVSAQKDVNHPQYLEEDTMYDIAPLLSSLFTSNERKKRVAGTVMVKALDPDSWPSENEVGLDKSQYDALKAALTKELAIIQGPPGTGKTYIGLRIVQLILHNKSKTCLNSPILVVCYTNHALDQFLEGVQKFNRNIVRVGGSCKSDTLKPFVLNQSSKIWKDKKICEQLKVVRNIKKKIDTIESEIIECSETVLGEDILKRVMIGRHLWSLEKYSRWYIEQPWNGNIILDWLEIEYELQQPKSSNSSNSEEEYSPQCTDLVVVVFNKAVKQYIANQLSNMPEMPLKNANSINNVWQLSMKKRWQLYKHWLNMFLQQERSKLPPLQEQLGKETKVLKNIRRGLELRVLRSAKIVGMTTTGAAKYSELLHMISPEIVVVEEAAEILEPHVVTAMTSGTKQLILIGDHKQLRPKVGIYELVVKYHLDLSLFERMVNNGIEYYQLQLQHRMRPEVACLIVPHIYPVLENHRSVLKMGNIRGVTKNVFFVTHKKLESEDEDSTSRMNRHEATFVVNLCKYFVQQPYEPSKITILTTYSGQLAAIRNIIKSDDHHPCKDVKVTVVDNYQGEENDIIIISFVRSNEQGKIGFLSSPNRVCVALSRARKGLFCIGNFLLYAKVSSLWKSIVKTLKENDSIGIHLSLLCQKYRESLTQVSDSSHFLKVSDGGCSLRCGYRLACGHACDMKCHLTDPDHAEYRCAAPCAEMCERKHKCPLTCSQSCPPCAELVEKTFSCLHVTKIPCYEYTDVTECSEPCEKINLCGHRCLGKCSDRCDSVRCNVLVTVKLPCGNNIQLPCQTSWNSNCYTTGCKIHCNTELKCGHICKGTCITCHHGRLHEACRERCNRMLICGHACKAPCSKPCPPCDICPHGNCSNYCVSCAPCSDPYHSSDMLGTSDSTVDSTSSDVQIKGANDIVSQCRELLETRKIKEGWVKVLIQIRSRSSLMFAKMLSNLLKVLERNNELKFIALTRCMNIITLAKILFDTDLTYNLIRSCFHNFEFARRLYNFTVETWSLIKDFVSTEFLTASEAQFEEVTREVIRYQYLVKLLAYVCKVDPCQKGCCIIDKKILLQMASFLCVPGPFDTENEESYNKLARVSADKKHDIASVNCKNISIFSLSCSKDHWKTMDLDVSTYINYINSSVNYISELRFDKKIPFQAL